MGSMGYQEAQPRVDKWSSFGLGAYIWFNRMFLDGYKRIFAIGDLFYLDQGMPVESLQLRHRLNPK